MHTSLFHYITKECIHLSFCSQQPARIFLPESQLYLFTDVADRRNLEPLYQSLHSAIRQVDNDHIILFEPTVIITNLPLKSISSTGLTRGPGGEEFNDR